MSSARELLGPACLPVLSERMDSNAHSVNRGEVAGGGWAQTLRGQLLTPRCGLEGGEGTQWMRTNKCTYYDALLWPEHSDYPSMKEARRDLDRQFFALRNVALHG